MMRVLIGVALIALIFFGYKYTESKIILIGFATAYVPALFALIASSFRGSRAFVAGGVKFCVWLALGTVVLYLCNLSRWNPYILFLFAGSYFVVTAIIVLYSGKNLFSSREEQEEDNENTTPDADADD